jgi:hypothetical protein
MRAQQTVESTGIIFNVLRVTNPPQRAKQDKAQLFHFKIKLFKGNNVAKVQFTFE